MKLIANIIWIIFGGFVYWLAWTLLGLLLCITIIGIPLGKQCFKCAKLLLAPFGKKVTIHFSAHPFANAVWAVICGWEMALGNFISGILMCVTIIGIPCGLQMFKMASLSIFPFGATVR